MFHYIYLSCLCISLMGISFCKVEGKELEFTKDKDIQEALIGIVRKELSEARRQCPIVLLYDEQMPELSMSYFFIYQMQKTGRIFILVNFSADKLSILEKIHGSRDFALILEKILSDLYKRSSCYLFIIWVKNPTFLYPEILETKYQYHPGWRQSDRVILVVHHITKRYKALIGLRFWDHFPNVIGVKKSKEEVEGFINIFTVFPYLIEGKRKSQEIDVYLVHEKRFARNRTLFFDKLKNLHHASINLGILWKEPFFIWGNTQDPYLDGLDWRIFKLCQKHLNFTFTVSSINYTGRMIGNDSWSGMMGKIADGSIDVGLGGISVTTERLQYYDFCRIYYTDSFTFIAPLNSHAKTAIDALIKPFDQYVWLAVFITMLIGMLSLHIVTEIEKRMQRTFTKENNFEDAKFTSPFITSGFIFTVFCQKPFRYLPKAFAIQCVYHGISLTIFLLGLAFSSCLISVVLSFKPPPVADKVDDMMKTGLPISMKNYDGHLYEYLETSSSPLLQQIFNKVKLVDYFESFIAIDQVVEGKMIYIDSKAKILFTGRYRYFGSNGLKFHVSSESILKFANLGWPVQKHWPLTAKFDAIIGRAVESGLVDFWMREFVKGKFGGDEFAWKIPSDQFSLTNKTIGNVNIDPSKHYDGEFVPLSRNHVQGIIKLFFIGVLLSILVFIGECIGGAVSIISRLLNRLYRYYKSKKTRRVDVLQQNQKLQKTIKPQSQNCNLVKKENGNFLSYRKRKSRRPKGNSNQFPELIWNDFQVKHN